MGGYRDGWHFMREFGGLFFFFWGAKSRVQEIILLKPLALISHGVQ